MITLEFHTSRELASGCSCEGAEPGSRQGLGAMSRERSDAVVPACAGWLELQMFEKTAYVFCNGSYFQEYDIQKSVTGIFLEKRPRRPDSNQHDIAGMHPVNRDHQYDPPGVQCSLYRKKIKIQECNVTEYVLIQILPM